MIELKNVSFTYQRTKKEAIKDISFEIKKGEIFGFLGPSGAGKTTTQRLIIGLLRGYQGSIKVLGKERSEWSNDFFERIGVAFEMPNLYLKLTAKENLNLIGSYYKNKNENISALLDRVGLLAFQDKKVESFSKGMKMRLNFVRSLLHDPDIIFLDEPTTGLDPGNAKIVREMIIEQKERGKTIFLTSHDMNVVDKLCDRVAFIVDGQLSIIETPKDLKRSYGKKTVGVEYLKDDQVQTMIFSLDRLGENNDFLKLLKEEDVRTIHSHEASLDDIFIEVTGRELSWGY